jgi:hypothetical protein
MNLIKAQEQYLLLVPELLKIIETEIAEDQALGEEAEDENERNRKLLFYNFNN